MNAARVELTSAEWKAATVRAYNLSRRKDMPRMVLWQAPVLRANPHYRAR